MHGAACAQPDVCNLPDAPDRMLGLAEATSTPLARLRVQVLVLVTIVNQPHPGVALQVLQHFSVSLVEKVRKGVPV